MKVLLWAVFTMGLVAVTTTVEARKKSTSSDSAKLRQICLQTSPVLSESELKKCVKKLKKKYKKSKKHRKIKGNVQPKE